MDKEEFKAYQRALNAKRVNTLNSEPKLAPTILFGDEDLFIEDIDFVDIKLSAIKPPQVMKKPERQTDTKTKPLF